MEHLPWKVMRAETVYDSPPYVRVEEQTVELPDGRMIEPYYRIELRSWVVMMAVTPEGRVVIARQYRHGIGRVSLMLPGGLLEEGEDPLAAARRELLEETGYASEAWESLGRFVPNSNYRCGEAHLYLARQAQVQATPNADDLEEMELLLLPLDVVLEELRVGNVVSLSSVALISLAAARLRS